MGSVNIEYESMLVKRQDRYLNTPLVFTEKIRIHSSQAEEIKSWSSNLTKNNRDLQSLNGRKIYFSSASVVSKLRFKSIFGLILGLWMAKL